ncbi:MAG: class I SAM-dependent methyltransferase [Acidobacteriota bacterium]|nr:class I SAM-dependent methyltransferase [Acidobacteriota bacterium]
MASLYLRIYNLFPEFLKRRINPLEYAIEAFVESAVSAADGPVVLDAGAGEVRFQEFFANKLYLALDSRVGDPEWDYSKIHVCADLEAIPLPNQSVDLVLNIQVLEHVRNPQSVLRELCRVLKPGGCLYLTVPQGWPEHQQPCDYYRFTQYSLEMLLESVGFERITIEPLGGYFHYLGHRLTYIPKILFKDRRGLIRLLLFPLELVSLISCCFVGPIVCYYLDQLDQTKEFTLCYKCVAIR